ncbi:MAG: methyltransferase domain-containing protein [Alphaproteobacteria bacterium]|nr:methyltransferase domain-containing protein [Alphaproteobacteria bacterium]
MLLRTGEISVKDLTLVLDQSQPRVSRHLRLMAEAGLVTRYAEGSWAFFSLKGGHGAAMAIGRVLQDIDPNDPVLVADRERLGEIRAGHRARAAAYFANVARSWDKTRSLHVPETDIEAAILDLVGGTKIGLCLDLGTGTGRMLELLGPKAGQCVGIDSSRAMIAMARAKFSDTAANDISIRLGDIEHLEEYEKSADLILMHQVLHYLEDPGAALASVRGALKPGGTVLLVDFAPHAHRFLASEHAHRRLGFSNEQIASWAVATGLGVTHCRQFPSKLKEKEGLTVCLWLLKETDKEQAA